MRAVLLFFTCLVANLCVRAQVEIRRVWPEYREAESFDRISEYFNEKENTGGEIVLRTQPGERAGYYFLVRVRNSGAGIPDARIELNLIAPDSPVAKQYSFPAPLPARSEVINLGLTGKDWLSPTINPVAWEIRLLAADGRELARKQSYLWAKPPTAAK